MMTETARWETHARGHTHSHTRLRLPNRALPLSCSRLPAQINFSEFKKILRYKQPEPGESLDDKMNKKSLSPGSPEYKRLRANSKVNRRGGRLLHRASSSQALVAGA